MRWPEPMRVFAVVAAIAAAFALSSTAQAQSIGAAAALDIKRFSGEPDEGVLPREDRCLDIAQRDDARREQHHGPDGSLLGAGADAGNEGDNPHRDERERDSASGWSRVADAQPSFGLAQWSVTSISLSTRSAAGFSTRSGSGPGFLGKMRSSATASVIECAQDA